MADPTIPVQAALLEATARAARNETLRECIGAIMGERKRLLKLQGKNFVARREAQIAALRFVITLLRKRIR